MCHFKILKKITRPTPPRDLRTKSTARNTFDGKSEAVRDIKFSPINGYEFASAFENGTLQKWDLRNSAQFERKWSAHNGLALSLDWHPDGRVIASGGRDKLIKFWDVKTDSRKPFHSIQTMASVAHMEWRPGHETQLASCSLSLDNRIQIFDLCRPFIPLSLLDDHEESVTEFVWRDSDTLYSCSKDCLFLVNRVSRMGHSPLKMMNDSTVAWTPKGDLFFANRSASVPRKSDPFGEEATVIGDHGSMATKNNRRTISILNRWDDKVHTISLPLNELKSPPPLH
jgi:WD40 repeat protein